MFENLKSKYGNKRNVYRNHHLKDRLDTEFTVCYGKLMPEEAATTRHHLPYMTHIAIYAHQA